MCIRDSHSPKEDREHGIFFTYDADNDYYICSQEKILPIKDRQVRKHGKLYSCLLYTSSKSTAANNIGISIYILPVAFIRRAVESQQPVGVVLLLRPQVGHGSVLSGVVVHLSLIHISYRLKAEKCELCGATGKLIMHHVRNRKDLKGKESWKRLMSARKRKTIASVSYTHLRATRGRVSNCLTIN